MQNPSERGVLGSTPNAGSYDKPNPANLLRFVCAVMQRTMTRLVLGDLRPSVPILSGLLLVFGGTMIYGYLESFMSFVTPERARLFESEAVVYLGVLLTGGLLVGLGFRKALNSRADQILGRGVALLSPGWLVPYVLSRRRYRRLFAISTLAYGLVYAVITSMLVYQPAIDFVEAYGASFPSAVLAPCCGAPLYSPVVTIYLANHVGLLLIPLTLVMLVTVSVLVGLNFSLAVFAFDSRAKGLDRTWVGGMGAVVGLFTGCPTCAGLLFANALGGAGAISFSAVLAYYQPVFIALSIPVLLGTPFLISRRLSRVFRDGCLVLGADGQPVDS